MNCCLRYSAIVKHCCLKQIVKSVVTPAKKFTTLCSHVSDTLTMVNMCDPNEIKCIGKRVNSFVQIYFIARQ